MKANFGLLFKTCFLFGMFIASCKKSGDNRILPVYLPGEMTNGTVSAFRGDVNWLASGFAWHGKDNPDYFYIKGWTYNEIGSMKEEIFIGDLPPVPGRYPIMKKANPSERDGTVSATYSFGDEDVIEGIYFPDNSFSDNFVELLEYDSIEMHVKGEFNVHFKVSRPEFDLGPETIYFSKGTFEIQLPK